MCSKPIRIAIFLFSLVLDSVRSELIQAHIVFRHGEKAIDTDFMYPTDPYKNHTFAPYGAAQLTNEGKRSMYNLGSILRKRYDEFLGDLYVANMIDSWSSSFERCQTSLLTVLASLFPPKGPLIWNENLNWQPIPYQCLPRERDDLFTGIGMKDFVKEYNQYYFNEGRKKLPEGTDVILSYVQAHSNATIRTLNDLMYFYLAISAEESYGLTLPEWTRKVYPQPISDLILLEFSLQLETKGLRRKAVGKLMMKILKDSDNRIKNNSSYKLHLYAGHDATIVWILMLLGLMYNHHPNFGACLILELHEENGGHFLEVHYRDDKHSQFELLRFRNGEKRLYFHEFRDMMLDLFEEEGVESKSSEREMLHPYLPIGIISYYCLQFLFQLFKSVDVTSI